MKVNYNGIELNTSKKDVVYTASNTLALINDSYASKHIEYTDILSNIINTDSTDEQIEKVSNVFTLIAMAYQVRNGGVFQYYDNGYNEGKDKRNDTDCYIYDKETISEIYKNEIIPMVKAVYGTNSKTYERIVTIADIWDCVSYEDGEISEEYYYEDVWDEDMEDYVTEEYVEEIESDPYVNMGSEFEREFYNFDEYDSIMEMYAEYTYKKYFADTNA